MMKDFVNEFRASELDTIADVFGFTDSNPLRTFTKIWHQVFLWSLFSSVFVHTSAALIAFGTLRKHKFGKFFPIFLIISGLLTPVTSGVLSSAAIAFVYRASGMQMLPIYALIWGVGQTVLYGAIGFTRILATL